MHQTEMHQTELFCHTQIPCYMLDTEQVGAQGRLCPICVQHETAMSSSTALERRRTLDAPATQNSLESQPTMLCPLVLIGECLPMILLVITNHRTLLTYQ